MIDPVLIFCDGNYGGKKKIGNKQIAIAPNNVKRKLWLGIEQKISTENIDETIYYSLSDGVEQ